MKRHWLGTFCYLVGSGAQRGLPFLLLPVFTRALSTDEFGALSLATAAAAVLAIVLGFNPQVYLIARYHRFEAEELSAVLSNSTFAVVSSAIVASIAGAAWMAWGPDLGIGYSVVAAVVVLGAGRALLSLFLALLQLRERPAMFLVVNLGVATATAGIVVIALVCLRYGWRGALGAEAVSVMTGAMLIVAIASFRGELKESLSLEPLRHFLRFALPLLPHALALWIMAFIDRVMLAVLVDTETVGLYSAGYTLGLGLSLFYEALQRSWQPTFFADMGRG
jgi:O-antigen/teichoic acid export membrane protein